MSRLNPPLFVGCPLQPGILKRAELEKLRLQRFRRAARVILVSNSAMPVDQSDEQLPAPALVSNSAMSVDKPVLQLPAPARQNLRLQRFKRAARLRDVSAVAECVWVL